MECSANYQVLWLGYFGEMFCQRPGVLGRLLQWNVLQVMFIIVTLVLMMSTMVTVSTLDKTQDFISSVPNQSGVSQA